MNKVKLSQEFPVPADEVWKLVGGFNALQDWHPAVEKSEQSGEGVGATRTLHLAGGGTIVERLESMDDGDRVYTYSIVDSPLPVANYHARLHVRDGSDGKGTVVEWSSEFKSEGASDNDATKVIEGIFEAGLANLRKMLGG